MLFLVSVKMISPSPIYLPMSYCCDPYRKLHAFQAIAKICHIYIFLYKYIHKTLIGYETKVQIVKFIVSIIGINFCEVKKIVSQTVAEISQFISY